MKELDGRVCGSIKRRPPPSCIVHYHFTVELATAFFPAHLAGKPLCYLVLNLALT